MNLFLETRDVTVDGRTIVGRVVPYDEVSYLVPSPRGERIRRGAFQHSINRRGGEIFLNRLHDESECCARSVADGWHDGPDGLVGTFVANRTKKGDETLDELAQGIWPYMSVAFRSNDKMPHVGSDGVLEIREAFLAHVALVRVPAYEGARVLAVRQAAPVAPWPTRPADW